MGWALATFFRQVGVNKTSNSGILERVQSFIMKDKRSFKIPGSRSAKTKVRGVCFFVVCHCNTGAPLAALPSVWWYRDGTGTGWSGVSIL